VARVGRHPPGHHRRHRSAALMSTPAEVGGGPRRAEGASSRAPARQDRSPRTTAVGARPRRPRSRGPPTGWTAGRHPRAVAAPCRASRER
jgi:hypothetical protein